MSQPKPGKLSDSVIMAELLDVSSFKGPAGFAIIDGSGKMLARNERMLELSGVTSIEPETLDTYADSLDPVSAEKLTAAIACPHATLLVLMNAAGLTQQLQLGQLRGNTRLLFMIEASQASGETPDIALDSLTGLDNRHVLDQTLAHLESARSLSNAPRRGSNGDRRRSAILLLIDLDRFKRVNDTLGHAVGDTLLKKVSSRLRRLTRDTDHLLRLGGDEFLLVQPQGSDSSQAEKVGHRIVNLLGRPFLVEGNQINIGACIGIANFDTDVENGAALLRNATLALQEAKSSGVNRVISFEPRMAQAAMERRELEIELRRALVLQQFRLVYQPQVELATGRLTGFEALLRWEHPVKGAISPMLFVPIAEETGDIQLIGAWVMLEACRQASHWPDELTVAVNVSPLQFDDGKLPGIVQDALSRSELIPERLEIEVTEGLLFHNPEAALTQLSAIRQMGIDVAMDDFGTGYSSLSHLSRFPFTKIKIDQAFIRGDVDDSTQAMVDTIISLGASLGMKTLAEGVETEEQYSRLHIAGCDAVQGYLISRPMEFSSVEPFLDSFNQQSIGPKVGT